jgi:hypothetical protein
MQVPTISVIEMKCEDERSKENSSQAMQMEISEKGEGQTHQSSYFCISVYIVADSCSLRGFPLCVMKST